jgi:hypothetical protein
VLPARQALEGSMGSGCGDLAPGGQTAQLSFHLEIHPLKSGLWDRLHWELGAPTPVSSGPNFLGFL